MPKKATAANPFTGHWNIVSMPYQIDQLMREVHRRLRLANR